MTSTLTPKQLVTKGVETFDDGLTRVADEPKKYPSCPVPAGQYCPKHGVRHEGVKG